MNTITFTCETITPMFLSGADGSTPELRPPSIKGALRFWWRAMNGHLDLKTLKEQESLIFGGTDGESGGRSKVLIRIKNHKETEQNLKINERSLLVEHKNTVKPAFIENQHFHIILSTTDSQKFSLEKLASLFFLVSMLGGFGKRARRGKGAIKIMKYKVEEKEWENYTQPDAQELLRLLNVVSEGRFTIRENIIKSEFRRVQNYPCIEKIQIGRQNSLILRKISDTTHKLHSRLKNSGKEKIYSMSLGFALGKKRLASPIYTSVIKTEKGLQPIITTLNAIPEYNNDKGSISPDLQEEFRQEIL